MQLKIEYLNKNDLKPYVNNAKIHTERQVEQIKKSIEEFDFNDPIAVWGENEIVEGHGRLLAAMEMDNIDTVPVIRLDHLSDKQRKAYALAHNKLTMNTDFDVDILAKEVSELEGIIDLTDIGFNEAELLELEIDDSPEDVEPVPVQRVGNGDIPEQPQYEMPSPVSGEHADGISAEELNEYKQKAAESSLITRRVIVIYRNNEEEALLKELFGVEPDKPLGVIYQASDIRK